MTNSLNMLLCLAMVVLCGCGKSGDFPEIARAHGVVNYQGKPLASASIIFTPESGPLAVGMTNENGEFELQTQGKVGAKVGKHTVMIQAVEAPTGAKAVAVDPETGRDLPVQQVSRIPVKYGNPISSGLTAEVNPKQDNVLTFDLK